MGELGPNEPGGQLDLDACVTYTQRCLQGQGWELIDAHALANQFWPQLQSQGLVGSAGQKAVEQAVWGHYATLMYDSCRRPDHPRRKQAWLELREWLEKAARTHVSHPQERSEVVQETLIQLHESFEKDALEAPRALWAFALRTLRNTGVSRHRWHAAKKRGQNRIESLEEYEERRYHSSVQQPAGESPRDLPLRPLEDSVINRDRRRRLDQFFESHLKSELQLIVARAFFLENQTPAEIASLMQKSPHEVRMIKARAVRVLRALPRSEIDKLLEILDAPTGGEEEDHDAGA